jgi:hypothetical protein
VKAVKVGDQVAYFAGVHGPVPRAAARTSTFHRAMNGTPETSYAVEFNGGWVPAIVDRVNSDGTLDLRYPHPLDGEFIATGELTPTTIMATCERAQEGTGAFMWQRR